MGDVDGRHIALQYERLKRHQGDSEPIHDHITLLDLANALRQFADMKGDIDALAVNHGVALQLPVFKKRSFADFRDADFVYAPLARGVRTPNMVVGGYSFVKRAMTPDEIKRDYEAGPPVAERREIEFTEWLGLTVAWVRFKGIADPGSTIQVSREQLIRRIANFLGGSHPYGMKPPRLSREQIRVDECIKLLLDPFFCESIIALCKYPGVAPIPYLQLMEIARDTVDGLEPLVAELG